MKYLGIKYLPNGSETITTKNINENLLKLKQAALKTPHKFDLLKTFLFPSYIAKLQNIRCNKKILKDFDLKIRKFIKNTLKLNIHASNHIIYCPIKRGGLGIFELASNIPVIMSKRPNNLRNISDNMNTVVNMSAPILNRINGCI